MRKNDAPATMMAATKTGGSFVDDSPADDDEEDCGPLSLAEVVYVLTCPGVLFPEPAIDCEGHDLTSAGFSKPASFLIA